MPAQVTKKATTLLLVLLSLLGLADALYLTYDHGAFHADPAGYGGGLCGADGGCSISRSSALSEIPLPGSQLGLPTAVLALGFYVVFLVLTGLRARASAADPRTRMHGDAGTRLAHLVRLQFGLAVLACVYSLFLMVYSLVMQGTVCKFCAGLYVVNAGLLVVTWMSLGESLAAAINAVGKAIFSRAGAVAAVVMVLVLVGSFIVYRGQVLAARAAAPPPPTAVLDTTGRPHKGPADASVHIVEFADFECPHCKIAFQALEEVIAVRNDVRVSFMNFPLDQACNPMIDRPFHARACELAAIGECAHLQGGRFFEAAPFLFEGLATPELMTKLAAAGFDRPALEACVKDGKASAQLQSDIKVGIAAKIEGTPAVFLNGAQIGGALPKDKLLELIDLAKSAMPKAASPHP